MIIINDKNIENSVYFPKNLYKNDSSIYTVILNNRGTNKIYKFENLEDEKLVAYDFYVFIIDFSELPVDEYEYTIYGDDNSVYGKGIIKLNEVNKENIYYEKNREYITYDKQ